MAGQRKSRPRFVHKRGVLIDDHDKPRSYFETRGIRELTVPISIEARTKSSPRAQEIAQHLSTMASEILKHAGEKSLSDVIESTKQTKPNDEDKAIKEALAAWHFNIGMRYGLISPVTLASGFLGGIYSITGSFVDGLPDKQSTAAVTDVGRRMQQVFAFCDDWHWLHMEIYEEHQRALAGAQSAKGLAAAVPARTQKKKERAEIVRQVYEAYSTKSVLEKRSLLTEANKRLKQEGHRPYTAGSFKKRLPEFVGKIKL